MRYPLKMTFAILVACTAPWLVAQSPSDWFQLLHKPQDHVLVQARLVTVDENPCLQFRNDGQEQINFYFSVKGEDPFTNPRVHLNAHKRSPFLPLPAGATGRTVKLTLVRVGQDQGKVEPD